MKLWLVAGAMALTACAGRAELGERRVLAMTSAMTRATSHGAYQRAEERSEGLARGMSVAEVEETMDAFVAVEKRDGVDGEPLERRTTLVEGRLCIRDPSIRRQRWVFGYDERKVVFVGFVAEFDRKDEGDDWTLRRVDRQPNDTCEPGETGT